jgi:hypothetical protein
MDVKQIAMHIPRDYAADIQKMVKSNVKTSTIENYLEKSVTTVSNIQALANQK